MHLLCAVLALCLPALAPAQTVTTLHSMSTAEGTNLESGVVYATDGAFYGTTTQGGAKLRYGTVFRMTPAGVVTRLYSFTGGLDGGAPGQLMQASDGNFYGTTRGYGAFGRGTLFRVTTAGVLTVLHAFSVTEGQPAVDPPVEAADGFLYSTTRGDSASTGGAIFKIATDGTGYETVYPLSVGSMPIAGLLLGEGDVLYGTTHGGGANNLGTVFRVTTAGTDYQTLHEFNGLDGGMPDRHLVLGADLALYGATYQGQFNCGSIYRITTGDDFTNLHNFGGKPDGMGIPSLALGADGSLYGTQFQGGATNKGTLFRITSAGAFTRLHDFAGYPTDGDGPLGALVQTPDGLFYGTSVKGGTLQKGGLFSLDLALPAAASLAFTPNRMIGNGAATGAITLYIPAGTAGVAALTSNTAEVSVPVSVDIPAGATVVTFPVTISAVTVKTTATVIAPLNGASVKAIISLYPVGVKSIAVKPSPVKSGSNATVTITLDAAAAPGDITVSFGSSNASVLAVPTSVIVPAGKTAVSIAVTAGTVSSNTPVTLSAWTAGGATRTKSVTVTP